MPHITGTEGDGHGGVGEKKKSSSGGGKSLLWDAAVRNKPNVLNANVRDATYPRRRPGFVVLETVFRDESIDTMRWETRGWLVAEAVAEFFYNIYYTQEEARKTSPRRSSNISRSISLQIHFIDID